MGSVRRLTRQPAALEDARKTECPQVGIHTHRHRRGASRNWSRADSAARADLNRPDRHADFG
jgi:hypothetical protein